MNTFVASGVSLFAGMSAVAIGGCGSPGMQPNPVARGMDVTWEGGVRTSRVHIQNESDNAAGPFMVHFNADEEPESQFDRPQVSLDVPGMGAREKLTLDVDFSPLATAFNYQLGHVKRITVLVDPKETVAEGDEGDNTLATDLPQAPDTIEFGPVLRPETWLVNNVTAPLVQTFKVPFSARLVGVQVTALACAPASGQSVTLNVRSAGSTLGSVSVPLSAFTLDCNAFPGVIPAGHAGPGYFDLHGAPIALTAGTEYELQLLNPTPDVALNGLHVGIAHQAYDDGVLSIFGGNVGQNDLAFRLFFLP